jgi:hypothetical protein
MDVRARQSRHQFCLFRPFLPLSVWLPRARSQLRRERQERRSVTGRRRLAGWLGWLARLAPGPTDHGRGRSPGLLPAPRGSFPQKGLLLWWHRAVKPGIALVFVLGWTGRDWWIGAGFLVRYILFASFQVFFLDTNLADLDLPLMRFHSSLGVLMVTRSGSGSGTRPGGYGLVLELAGALSKPMCCIQRGWGIAIGGVNRAGLSLFSVWSCLFGPGAAGDGGVELSRPARRSPHAPRGSKERMRAGGASQALNCLGIEDVWGSRTVRGSSRNRQSVARPLSLVTRSFVCETCSNLFGQLLRQCEMGMADRARIRLSTLNPIRPVRFPRSYREQGCGCVAAPVKRFPILEGVGM